MIHVGGIYDNGPISPICKIKENITVWSQAKWTSFKVEYIEPMPASLASTVNWAATAGSIAANATIAKALSSVIQLDEHQLMHFRFRPIDDIELLLWEQAGQGRFASKGYQARVDLASGGEGTSDPYWANTTFFVLGKDRDAQMEVRNPTDYATTYARCVFWGYRYVITPIDLKGQASTYLPAEGLYSL